MGNAQSPSKDPRFLTACRAFSEKELEDLKRLFSMLAHQSQSNAQFISGSVFWGCLRIPPPLGDRLFYLAKQKRRDIELTFENFVIAKAIYERGTRDEIEEFIYQLLDVTGDGIVNRSDLEAVLCGLYGDVLAGEGGMCWHKNFLAIFIGAATFSKIVEGYAEKGMSLEDCKRWCSLVPSVRKFLGSLMMTPDSGRPGFKVPHLLHSENEATDFPVLRREYAWHIGGALPHHELEEWKLLYHSSVHGLSFTTFLGNISNEEGPTVLIIKDKEGYVYGGYASQPWERHGDFYGDMKSFLFQLVPVAAIYRPTGANANLQWCAVNFTSENIPNGLGFGGRAGHFGLFLSASFDQGHTMACTTFGSPELSKSHNIIPEVIECWGVVSKEAQLEKSENLRGTVLERFKEDRHMLNLMGIANSSE